jgi:hypothetical protein
MRRINQRNQAAVAGSGKLAVTRTCDEIASLLEVGEQADDTSVSRTAA